MFNLITLNPCRTQHESLSQAGNRVCWYYKILQHYRHTTQFILCSTQFHQKQIFILCKPLASILKMI